MYKYETHLHTYPASNCGHASVRETLEFYKKLGYDGVFITNHFLDGNINLSYRELPYKEQIELFFADYEEGKKIGAEIGLKVFCGLELSYGGTDFLVYGLDKKWYLSHPEIMEMKKSRELPFLIKNGAFVVHAHPFREAGYIDHIRLFPRCVQAVEVVNACRTEFENNMADLYANQYNLLKTAGSDNHNAEKQTHLAGMETNTPLTDELDFIERIKNGQINIFTMDI